jgi:hypothetical protein
MKPDELSAVCQGKFTCCTDRVTNKVPIALLEGVPVIKSLYHTLTPPSTLPALNHRYQPIDVDVRPLLRNIPQRLLTDSMRCRPAWPGITNRHVA